MVIVLRTIRSNRSEKEENYRHESLKGSRCCGSETDNRNLGVNRGNSSQRERLTSSESEMIVK